MVVFANPLPWFSLRVRPRHEKMVSLALRIRGYEEFLPLFTSRNRWADRYKCVQLPLFPGYLFCRFDPAKRFVVLETPGVIDIVGIGRKPAAIDARIIEDIQTV